jgi:sugar phosphate isomerase/epimerase
MTSMHPRACVSAICTFRLSLEEDLAFWAAHGIDRVGVSIAKLDAHGWHDGVERVRRAIDGGLQIVDLIGLGPLALTEPARWDRQRDRLVRCVEAAAQLGTGTLVLTTGPATPLTFEAAADALDAALAPVLDVAAAHGVRFAIEHTNSLRVDVGFVHTLRDACDLARRLGVAVCMEVNACWAERGLATTVAGAVGQLALVQVSDFRVGTHCTPDRLVPGDGDIPLARVLRSVIDAGYGGTFELELIGPAIEAEGYDRAVPRALDALDALLSGL